MPPKTRLPSRGKHTVYVEHGVWYDAGTKHIHVTIPGADSAHWSYGRTSPRWNVYKAILQDAGRWPDDAPD